MRHRGVPAPEPPSAAEAISEVTLTRRGGGGVPEADVAWQPQGAGELPDPR